MAKFYFTLTGFTFLNLLKAIIIIGFISDLNSFTIISNYHRVCLENLNSQSTYYFIPTNIKDVNLFHSASGGKMCSNLLFENGILCVDNVEYGHVSLIQEKDNKYQTFSIIKNAKDNYSIVPTKNRFNKKTYYAFHLIIIISLVICFYFVSTFFIKRVNANKNVHTIFILLDLIVSITLLYSFQYRTAIVNIL